jgi:protein-O-mannosyltransferase-like protein
MPVIGLLLGLALASKWVAAYAIGALVLLILIRSALGRVLAILGMIGLTSVLGYMAISVPAAAGSSDPGLGNLTFLLIMVALTLLGVVVAVLHPIAWTDEEWRFAIGAPLALGALVFFGALALGKMDSHVVIGSMALTPLTLALLFAFTAVFAAAAFWLAGRWGFGPFAAPPAADDPIRALDPPGPPAEGWLRPGALAGLPVVFAAASLLILPVAVYIVSYIPWAFVQNPQNQIVTGWPAGHTGQTLLELTWQMYGYHNGLTAAHPASSPWWAWPMNLKPVWFYQESLAAGTSAALYDAGSLVIWWMGIPAIAFVSWMAFRRRSLALTLIAIGFAAQWIPWARIDRAAFQYHYYTALPFVVMALAYFVAEVWHGASRHTWALARIAAGVAIVLPAVLWILSRPLCAFVGVDSVNPNSAACPAVIPQFVLTTRSLALAVIAVVGLLVIVLRFLRFEPVDPDDPDAESQRMTSAYRSLVVAGAVVAIALFGASFLPETVLLTLNNIPVEPIAMVVAVPLGYLGLQIFASRDARRWVVGFLVAVVAWFAILYPNISALPLPSAVVAAYQGILPTYLYAFQFPVSTVTRATDTPLFTPMLALLTIALIVTCLVVAYSAWVWRLALAETRAGGRSRSPASDDVDGLARSGGA